METTVEQELKSIYERDGILKPDAVIESAKDAKSPLHGFFDWDDSVAAAKWRIEQARELIRTVKLSVITERETIIAPYYIRDPRNTDNTQGYVATLQVKTERALAYEALAYEMNRLEAVISRVASLINALGLEKEIQRLTSNVAKLREKVNAAMKQAA